MRKFRFFSDTNQRNFEYYLDAMGRNYRVDKYVVIIDEPTEGDIEMAKENGGLAAD